MSTARTRLSVAARRPCLLAVGLMLAALLGACAAITGPIAAAPQRAAESQGTPPSTDTRARAGGNEPFWSIDVDGANARVRTPEEPGGVLYVDGRWRRLDATRRIYEAPRTAAGAASPLRLEISDGPCVDNMSGAVSPARATLTRNGRRMPGCARAPAADGVLRGSVTYRERIALPPDATVEVWIVDASPGMMIQAILAQTTVAAEGRQVPIRFELPYPRERVVAEHPYAVKAAIHGAGRMLFASEDGLPVITQGQPSEVAIVLKGVAGVQAAPP